jgi:hypothetical protein
MPIRAEEKRECALSMMSPNLRRVLWLMPVGLAVHDAEELIMLPGWVVGHRDVLARLAAVGPFGERAVRFLSGPPERLAVAIGLVVGLAFVFTLLAVRSGRRGLWFWVYAVLLGMAALHVIAHMGQAVYVGGYIPGLVGAVVCELPLSLVVYWRLLAEKMLTPRAAVVTAVAGIALFPLTAMTAHALASWLCA